MAAKEIVRKLLVLIIIGFGLAIYYPSVIDKMKFTHRDLIYGDDDVDFRIFVLTYNRAYSLAKSLHSLDDLLLDGDRAILEIWIDVDQHGKLNQVTEQFARSFSWKKGPTRVNVQPYSSGIMGQWIDTCKPRPGSREIALIVEDDVDVSPMAYRWLKAVHREMANRSDFAGASLASGNQRVLHSPKTQKRAVAQKTDTIFMYKCIGTFGFSPNPKTWRLFQEWFHLHKPSARPGFQLVVPDSMTTLWYAGYEKLGTASRMWEMWFIYYMHIEQLYVVFNNLDVFTGKRNSSLSYHRAEIGLHSKVLYFQNPDDSNLLTNWKDEFVAFPNEVSRLHWDGTPMGSRYYFL